MNAMGMTRKQQQLYDYICKEFVQKGVPPSYDEMLVELGLNSKSGAHRLVVGLEERGLITRLHGRARSIAPTTAPSTLLPEMSEAPRRLVDIRRVVNAANAGKLSKSKAIRQIDEILSGSENG